MPVGASVTLRKARMWEFVDRLVSISIPRIRDFRGLNPRSFDGRGNYSIGVREQLIFPEIDYDQVKETRGLDIAFATTAQTDEEGFELLLGLGFPFAQEGRPGGKSPEEIAAEEEEHRKEEARMRAEAEQAALEQLKEENPEAYAKPEPEDEEDEDGDGEEDFRVEKKRSNGKDVTTRQAGEGVQVQGPQLQPLPQVRSLPRGLPQVRPLPDLPARAAHKGYVPGMTKSSW